jgi:CRISPR/Cas system-associated exonuclease Cas4 (RecB family)
MTRIDPFISTEIFALLLLVGAAIFIWDILERKTRDFDRTSNLPGKGEIVSLQGSSTLPTKEFISVEEKLRSKPFGLIKEKGVSIPIEVLPFARKIRDRHIAQMLVHLRLVELNENKRPPYGIFFVGKEGRVVRIHNSEERQNWLTSLLAEMRDVEKNNMAHAAPAKFKCKNCDVRSKCAHSAYHSNGNWENDGGEE